ncbi:MAG: site-specific integrase [Candidatus Acidiferrales bacterium]
MNRSGIVERKPLPLFREFALQFLERVRPEIRPATYRWHLVALGLRRLPDGKLRQREKGGLLAPFGSKRLDEIRADEIERYKQAELERGLSSCTVNRALACLRRILLFAVKIDVLMVTPFVARKIRFLKENGRERILSFDEERRYLAVASQPLRDVATLILEMGLRPGEACSIRREDIHFYATPHFLHVFAGKTNNAVRDVPLTARAEEVLRRRITEAEKVKTVKAEYLFPLRVGNGHDWTRPMNELEPAHLRALRESKITPSFRVYDMRHTYGTRAVEGGTDPLTLMRLMGHADLKTTSRYVHLSKGHLAEAQKRIEQYRATREIAEAEAMRNQPIAGVQ